MPATEIQVVAPSRLHFGLFSFGDNRTDLGAGDVTVAARRLFGGVGAMVQSPGIRLVVRPADRLEARGPLGQRVLEFARRFAAAWGCADELRCCIEVQSTAPEHAGLGTGTQLGLAVAAGLSRFQGMDVPTAERLASIVGRGARSAIGTHGFFQGGLLLEEGKLPDEAISPLTARVELPPAWRFVLFVPLNERGRHGASEDEAFRRLPPVPKATTERLTKIATSELLPAAAAADFSGFSAALYRYGYEAGLCFASCQHGAFASVQVSALIVRLRGLGIQGVGQSSWGPTVFALVPDVQTAEQLNQDMLDDLNVNALRCIIAAPANTGATVVELNPAS